MTVFSIVVVLFVYLIFIYLVSLLKEDSDRVCRECYRSKKSTSTGSYQGYFCRLRMHEVKPHNVCNQFLVVEE